MPLAILTFGEVSYVQPEVISTGAVLATQTQMQFNIWKYPVDGAPVENVRRAVQITQQTPSVGPNDQEIIYLSDTGGHSNLWIMKLNNGETRQ